MKPLFLEELKWEFFFWFWMDIVPHIKRFRNAFGLNKKLSIEKRREIISQIPNGVYCYEHRNYKLYSCPFEKYKTSTMSICKLNFSLIDDQCKSCSINKYPL